MTDSERAVWMSVFGPAYLREQYLSNSYPARSADYKSYEEYQDELIRRDFAMAADAARTASEAVRRLRLVMEPGGMLHREHVEDEDEGVGMAYEAMEARHV